MYQIYMLIGVVHIIIGLLVSLYFIYFLMGHQFKIKNLVFSASQALLTILIGVLYVYVSVLLLKDKSESALNFNYGSETILNETDLDESFQEAFHFQEHPEDTTEFEVPTTLENYFVEEEVHPTARFQHFVNAFKDMVIKARLSYRNRQAREKEFKKQDEVNFQSKCNSKENLYHQFVFLYSFTQGLAFLINSVFDCKLSASKTSPKKDESTEETLERSAADKQLEDKVKKSFPRNYYLVILLSVFSLLLPILSSSCLFFMADFKPADYSSARNITQKLLESERLNDNLLNVIKNPVNWKVTNDSEADDIIDDIYKIMKHINSTEGDSFKHATNMYIFELLNGKFQEDEECHLETPALKIYTFTIIIAGYIAAVMYAKVTELKMQSHESNTETGDLKLHNLKTNEIGFTTTWLPGILELIYRKYIMHAMMPTVFSHLLLIIGNLDHVVSNLSRVAMTRGLVKSKNFIRPKV